MIKILQINLVMVYQCPSLIIWICISTVCNASVLGQASAGAKQPDSETNRIVSSMTIDANKKTYWLDEREYATGDGNVIEGPFTFSVFGKPTYIWEVATIPGTKLSSSTPYLIILFTRDTSRLQTSFKVWPSDSPSLATVGKINLSVCSFRFQHTYNLEGIPAQESFVISRPDGDRETVFSLEKGRVFVIRESPDTGGCNIVQLAGALPDSSTMTSVTKLDADLQESYALFEKWRKQNKVSEKEGTSSGSE